MDQLITSRLPIPTLDDRRFQDLVDETTRLVQRRCPQWSPFLPGDPGGAIIEAVAYLVDTLLYRLNQVPDVMYSRFLDLVDLGRRPATVASTDVDVFFSTPLATPFTLPVRTELATVATEDGAAVVFTTVEPATVLPAGELVELPSRAGPTVVGIGSTRAIPGAIVAITIEVEQQLGIAPIDLEWVCSTSDGWQPCEVIQDGTNGLTVGGTVMLAVGRAHASTTIDFVPAAWLRTRDPVPHVGAAVQAIDVVGLQVVAEHAHRVEIEVGISDGRHRQLLHLPTPAVEHRGEAQVLVDGTPWTIVPSLLASGPDEAHVELDVVGGVVRFGDGTRGRVPPAGSRIVVDHWQGGGTGGNVAAHAITVLRTTVPFVTQLDNRRPAYGGTDIEPVEAARAHAPRLLRSSWRAVTVADYEEIVRVAEPAIARVRCLEPSTPTASVSVVLVPHLPADPAELAFEDLLLDIDVESRVVRLLDERRVVGTRIVVGTPTYAGVCVEAMVVGGPHDGERATTGARQALAAYLHPLVGGRDRSGWPFGRALVAGELYAPLLAVPGIELVEQVTLVPYDPVSGSQGAPTDRIDLEADSLVFAGEHSIVVR